MADLTGAWAGAQQTSGVHVPELIGPLDPEEPRALAPAQRLVALQQPMLGHQPLGLLGIHGPAEFPAGQRGDHPGPVGRVSPGPLLASRWAKPFG